MRKEEKIVKESYDGLFINILVIQPRDGESDDPVGGSVERTDNAYASHSSFE